MSVTIIVTEFVPKLAQEKLELERVSVLILQLSVDALFTCAVVILPVPLPLRETVTF